MSMEPVLTWSAIAVMPVIVMLGILVMHVRMVIFTDLDIINIKS